MADGPLRFWHQGFVELEGAPGYRQALERHCAAVLGAAATVELHGMPEGSFAGTSPAEVARHTYLTRLHSNRVIDSVVEADRTGYDGAFIAILQDLGLDEARSLVDIPVVGYGESALHLACQLGRRFSVLLFNPDLAELMEERIDHYGLRSRMAPFALIDTDYEAVSRGFGDPQPLVRAFADAAERAVAAGADVLIPGQMILAEVLWQQGVHRAAEAPVVDALGACLTTLHALVTLRRSSGLERSRRGFRGTRPPQAAVDEARRRYLKPQA